MAQKKTEQLNRNKITKELLEKNIPYSAFDTTENLSKILEAGNQKKAPENSGTPEKSGLTEEQVSEIIQTEISGLVAQVEKLEEENSALNETLEDQEKKISGLTETLTGLVKDSATPKNAETKK